MSHNTAEPMHTDNSVVWTPPFLEMPDWFELCNKKKLYNIDSGLYLTPFHVPKGVHIRTQFLLYVY